MSGDLRGGQELLIKLVGGKVYPVLILPVPHGNGEGQDLDIQLLLHLGRNVRGRIGNKLNVSHLGLLIEIKE